MNVIEVEGLRRDFVRHVKTGRFTRRKVTVPAVDGITFAVEEGEAVGYIGANGAGKSTTIKMLTGILAPTAGLVRTCGLEPVRQRRELARQVGVVFGQRSQLWWDLPLATSLELLAAIHRLGPGWDRRRNQLVDRLDVGGFLQTPVRQLSLGQRMRGEVVAALLHSPRLLVLDEPTIGLDVLSSERLRVFLAEERAEHGTTLLLTTHDMDDVSRLCPRVLVVDSGKLVHDGPLTGLVESVGARRVLVVDLMRPVGSLGFLPGCEVVGVEGEGLRHRIAFPETLTAAAVLTLVSERAEVRDLSVEEPDIEDVVRRLYQSTSAGSGS